MPVINKNSVVVDEPACVDMVAASGKSGLGNARVAHAWILFMSETTAVFICRKIPGPSGPYAAVSKFAHCPGCTAQKTVFEGAGLASAAKTNPETAITRYRSLKW